MKSRILFLTILLCAATACGAAGGARAARTPAFRRAASYEANLPARMVRKIALPPGGYHEGLLLQDGAVWVSNGRGGKTWVVDPASGKVVSELEGPAAFTEAVAAVSGGRYWVTDWDARKMYLVRLDGKRMVPESEVSFAPARPAGAVWNGTHLYVITWSRGIGTKYYLVRMARDGQPIEKMRIRGIEEPSQLAWDGKDLWISSWFNRRVYRVDGETFELRGSFPTHIERTTGIAWDGSSFWVTGTAADLYQVELVPKKE